MDVARRVALIVDVREKDEWDAGHLRGALFLPLSRLRAGLSRSMARKLRKRILYLHCRSGGRALAAAGILKKAGCAVRPLRVGFAGLKKAGLPAVV